MTIMKWIFENLWLLIGFVLIIQAISSKIRARKQENEHPYLQEGYNRFIITRLVLSLIPAGILAYGILSGSLMNIFEILNLREMKAIVLLFHASFISIALYFNYWIHFKQGAEFLVEHPGLFPQARRMSNKAYSTTQIKLYAISIVIGPIIMLFMAWFQEVPFEELHSIFTQDFN